MDVKVKGARPNTRTHLVYSGAFERPNDSFCLGSTTSGEDVDIASGKRARSPLVAEAYAEGCPDLSPDGRHLVYTGHTSDHRPFAFLSEQSDGGAGVPAVPIAEPSMSSDPTWADSDNFTYEVDANHIGMFSLLSGRATVLPRSTSRTTVGVLRHVVRDRIFISAGVGWEETHLAGFSWPGLREEIRFGIRVNVLDLVDRGGESYYATSQFNGDPTPLLVIEPFQNRVWRSGFVPGQFIRYP